MNDAEFIVTAQLYVCMSYNIPAKMIAIVLESTNHHALYEYHYVVDFSH